MSKYKARWKVERIDLTPGARATNDISIEFEIQSKLGVL